MGHWGPGIFENDTVNDGIGELFGQIYSEIDDFLSDDDGGDPDEPETDVILGYLKILAVVYQNIPDLDVNKPSKEVVIKWRDKIYQAWDDFSEDEPYWPERRAVVEGLFKEVLEVCEERSDT